MESSADETNKRNAIDSILGVYAQLDPTITPAQRENIRQLINDLFTIFKANHIDTKENMLELLDERYHPNFKNSLEQQGIGLSDEDFDKLINVTFAFYMQFRTRQDLTEQLQRAGVPKKLIGEIKRRGGKRRTNKRIKYLKNKTRKNLFFRKYRRSKK
jgi:hypothetical protein